MTDCPHGNHSDERCAQCVATGRGQPGEQFSKRYKPKLETKQQEADADIRAKYVELLRKRKEAFDARAAAVASRQQQHLKYEGET